MVRDRYIRMTIAVGLACSLTVGYAGSYASAESESQLQQKLDGVKQKQLENRKGIDASRKKLLKNSDQQETVIDKLKASRTKIHDIQGKISAKQAEVDQSKAKMTLLKNEISKLTTRIKHRDLLLKNRIRSIYINGGAVSYIDVLFGAKSFGNFLDRLLALKMITDQDNKILTAQEKDKSTQESKKRQLNAQLVKMQNDLENLRTLSISLNEEKKHQQSLLARLKKDAADIERNVMDKNEEAATLKAQESVIKNQLASLAKDEARKKDQARKKAEETKRARVRTTHDQLVHDQSAGSVNESPSQASVQSPSNRPSTAGRVSSSAPVASADFIMPAAGFISSGFGYRSFDHNFHPGIDIAGSTGTPVKAAADGVVFRAYQSSSYGNCVMITHSIGGKIYSTVYAHLSAYSVSTGQKVSQGQVIGAIGSTGESTGPHLHFELYIGPWTPPPHNGSVNPLNYIK
ncbi:peptidase M23 [Sporolactobacillus sp. THM7-4]|nr:peptidase M23 [Sporolactobacillus sp. THM7-4]